EYLAGNGLLARGGERGGVRRRKKAAVQGEREVSLLERDGMVDGDELGAVGEGAFDLDLEDQLRHTRQHLRPPQHAAPEIHQLGHAAAIDRKSTRLNSSHL